MALKALKSYLLPLLTILGLALMGVSMFLLTQSTKSSGGFQEWKGAIFLINAIGVLVLLALIVINVWRLYKQYRQHVPGTRLTINMLMLLLPLVFIPLAFMYYFSTQFSNDAVDSWFNVDVEEGLQEALNLSRSTLSDTEAAYLNLSQRVALNIQNLSGANLLITIDELRVDAKAYAITIYKANGEILVDSVSEVGADAPAGLSDEIIFQVLQGAGFVELDNLKDGQLIIRTVVKIPQTSPIDPSRLLQIKYISTERINALAENAEKVYKSYNELTQAREPLKQGFSLSLGLAFLLSMLAAVWAAFNISRRLVEPIQTLATGTRAVAEGNYKQQLTVESSDEIGFLTQSFNAMTQRLADADEKAQRSQLLVENERANLAAILSRLSTGVLSFDYDLNLRRANHAADDILVCDFNLFVGQHIDKISNDDGLLNGFLQECSERVNKGQTEWREEFALNSKANGRRVIVVACSVLAGAQEEQGVVIVFDDVTKLIRAQRDSAWGEVARRLAHEIKNPLTPIQLSAERIRHRYLDKMPSDESEFLDKATQTIVSQVESMKNMVNAFRDYARAPEINFETFDLCGLLKEIVLLYSPRDKRIEVHTKLPDESIIIDADPDRLRQILHNLFSNAYDALNAELENTDNTVQAGKIWLLAKEFYEEDHRFVEIEIADTGSGFADDYLEDVFEPYVTTKPKGTGLGLAIVRKLVDEHHGEIQIANHYIENDKSGALIKILLPADEAARLGRLSQGSHSRANIQSSKSVNIYTKFDEF